ncbi:MAG: hypothetical protein KJZ87_02650 [Thermoguttaceae bacterium]|nr:hypothetical protein [Thermoguttaceae bacterium]
MSFSKLATILGLLVSTSTTPAEGVKSGGLPDPVVTRQTFFAIPFQVTAGSQPGTEAAEVQLYVSADQGRTWQFYDRVPPERGQFLFRTARDGEYWFVIRTMDRSGQTHADRTAGPGLRVVVDTSAPDLKLEAARGNAGQIAATWTLTETDPDPETLQIQYRVDGGLWQPLAVNREALRRSGPSWTDSVTWWPQNGSRRIEIRAEVADKAGNRDVTHAQIDLAAAPTPAQTPPDLVASAADNPFYLAQNPGPPGPPTSPSSMPPPANPTALPQGAAPVVAPTSPPVQSQYVVPAAKPTPSASPSPAEVAAAQPPTRSVNSRLFEMEYRIESAGSSAVPSVELWGTRDGGATWSRFGIDNDGRSPMLVSVDQEGLYGFKIAVAGGAGVSPQAPGRGTAADMLINVDLTRPLARIAAVEPGAGGQAGQLLIRWEASDARLAERPVSLYARDAAGGEWFPIAAEIENTGQYVWRAHPQTPARLLVRLEVRDEAGNVGVSETPQAVVIGQIPAETPVGEQAAPSAQIGGVKPLGHPALQASGGYRFR